MDTPDFDDLERQSVHPSRAWFDAWEIITTDLEFRVWADAWLCVRNLSGTLGTRPDDAATAIVALVKV